MIFYMAVKLDPSFLVQSVSFSMLILYFLAFFLIIQQQIQIIIQFKYYISSMMLSQFKTQAIPTTSIIYENIYNPHQQNQLQKQIQRDRLQIKLNETYEYPTERNFINIKSASKLYSDYTNQSENYNKFVFSVFDVLNIDKKNKVNRSQEKLAEKSEVNKNQQKESQSFWFIQPSTMKKPQAFMGAFIQTQKEFDCFDLNIKIPHLKQALPFSRILSNTIIQSKDKRVIKKPQEQKKEKQKQKESFFGESMFLSQYLESQPDQELKEEENKKLHLSDLDVSQIEHVQLEQQKSQLHESHQISNIFEKMSINQLQLSHKKYIQAVMWQQDSQSNNPQQLYNHSYQFYKQKCSQFIDRFESRMLFNKKIVYYTDLDVCSCLVRMILGVQSELFLLDYHTLEWRFNQSSVKFTHILKTSLQTQIQDILIIASCKSKLQSALKFIKKQSFRRILQEVALQTRQFLVIVEQIALQIQTRNGSILDFVMTLSQIKTSILLVYELFINQSWIKSQSKSYMDFDAVIFRQIVRLSNNNDNLIGKGYELSLRLLRAAFKPITFTLNRIVFQQTVEISNRDDTYLRYYFQNLKDLLSYLGKRIDLIKQQSNELYMICRIKQEIKIVMQTNQLQKYISEWNQIFKTKKKMIQGIEKREKKRKKQLKQKKQEQKIKQIFQLRSKLMKSIQETKQRKSQIYNQGVKQIERIKKEIMEREQRRRLNYLIQKEQEKGFLLQAELKQKRKLIQQKQELLAIAQKQGLQLVQKILINQNVIKKQQTQEQKLQKPNTIQIKKQKQKQQIIPKQVQIKKSHIKFQSTFKHKSSLSISVIRSDSKKQNPKPIEQKPVISSQVAIQRASSNFSIPNMAKFPQSQQDSNSSNNQESQNEIKSKQMIQKNDQNAVHVSTNTVLQLCIDKIIRQQIEITNMALSYLVYDQYQLFNLMEFMRKIFLTGNGSAISNFLHLSVSSDSKVSIQLFNQCSLFDYGDEFIRNLGPQFYQVHNVSVLRSEKQIRSGAGIYQNRKINIFQDSLQIALGFHFSKLPVMLQPYFSYIHLSKYMQIFSHLVKIRHCENLISSCLLSLNQMKKQLLADDTNKRFLKKIFLARHAIHIYLNTLQSYLFYRVIQKQLKTVRAKLKKRDINELSIVHLNMLDVIIRKGLIQNPHNDISKKIKGLLMEIRKFKNIVDSFCSNDIHSYVRDQIEGQVTQMHRVFLEEQHFLESLFYHP